VLYRYVTASLTHVWCRSIRVRSAPSVCVRAPLPPLPPQFFVFLFRVSLTLCAVRVSLTLCAESQKAFKAGDKGRAKELSEQGKAAGARMEKARDDQGNALFKMRNSKLDKHTIDLHGLQLEFAKGKLEAFLDKQAKSDAELLIITGAGNHSADKAKIKPEVHRMLKERKLKYEEVNNGSVRVTC
jgi:Smr domain/Domain of unknown function (DUF1771)